MKKTKTKFTLALGLCFLAWLFIFPENCSASEDDLIITEIMYDPEGSNSGHSDWIELYNPEDKTLEIDEDDFGIIDEEKLEMGKDGVHYLNCHEVKEDMKIKAGGYIVLASDKDDFEKDYPNFEGEVVDTTLDLSGNGDTIRLSDDKCETFFEEISYDDDWGGDDNGMTLEKIDLKKENKKDNWQESYIAGGTPGEKNSKKPEPKKYPHEIRINEVFPNPKDEDDEYVELYNFSKGKIDVTGWILKDSSKTGKFEFPPDSEIKAEDFLVVEKDEYKFSLNNSGEESVTLFDPNEEKVSEVKYKESKEEISYNFDGASWRWSKYLTPGKENKFNNLPKIKVKMDKKVYIGVYADFEAKATDADKDSLKFTWDFGDGHKSYKKETRHKYEKKGKYKGFLKVFDGSEEIVNEFLVEVKKFPGLNIDIIALSANPEGRDSKNEWIMIRNDSDDELNLKNWSVATGWKKLYNHPILEKFVLPPGKSKKLERDMCDFTLNNQKNKIELRYPDGRVADRVRYKNEEGVLEDEVYEEGEDGWQWIETQINADETRTNTDTTQTDAEEVEEEDFSEFIGGQSVDELSEKNREELLNLGTNIKLASFNYSNGGRVLGVSTEKDSPPVYKFTETKPAENRTFQLTKKISSDINLFLNRTINLFISFL